MNYNFKIINYEFRILVAKVLNKLIYTNYSYSAIYVIFISDKKWGEALFQSEIELMIFEYRFHNIEPDKLGQQMFGSPT